MPDDLSDRGVFAWSERQVGPLGGLARGEQVKIREREHAVDGIEDAGIYELNALSSHSRQMLVHLLRRPGRPDCTSIDHWQAELSIFRTDVLQWFCRRCDIESSRHVSIAM